jgi:hypothetical protein
VWKQSESLRRTQISIGPFKQRSSWPSSLVTGLIGWNGFFVIVAVILGDARSAGRFFLLATIAAVVQVVCLRLLFFFLRLDRSALSAAFWGAFTGAVAVIVETRSTSTLNQHRAVWIINGLYIGAAVGLFLRYFHNDDLRIQTEAAASGRPIDYGRDAHWLEPFFFGAVAYLIAFLPKSFSLAVIILVIGAMSGVVAAGVSHFLIFSVSRKSFLPLLLSIFAGAVQGALSGLLFRPFAPELLFAPVVHGTIAGCLTYLMTAVRGRALANKEGVGNLN